MRSRVPGRFDAPGTKKPSLGGVDEKGVFAQFSYDGIFVFSCVLIDGASATAERIDIVSKWRRGPVLVARLGGLI